MGVRYLSEGNYEEAVLAFTAAIEIDPNRPEAYLDLSEVYLARGDIQAAIDILTAGYDASGSDEVLQKRNALQTPAVGGDIDQQLQSMLQAETAVQYTDLPEIMTLEVADAIQSAGYPPVEQYGGVYQDGDRTFITGLGVNIDWTDSQPTPLAVTYYESYAGLNGRRDIGFRGIAMGDSYSQVLDKLGLDGEVLSAYDRVILALSQDGMLCEGAAERRDDGGEILKIEFFSEIEEFRGVYTTGKAIHVEMHFSEEGLYQASFSADMPG